MKRRYKGSSEIMLRKKKKEKKLYTRRLAEGSSEP